MGKQAYSVTHERDGNYRLHAIKPTPRVIAMLTAVNDRSDQIIGWKLKPLVVMQGAVSHLWRAPLTRSQRPNPSASPKPGPP